MRYKLTISCDSMPSFFQPRSLTFQMFHNQIKPNYSSYWRSYYINKIEIDSFSKYTTDKTETFEVPYLSLEEKLSGQKRFSSRKIQ